jgi:methylamine dehydrogenase heavy chain
VWLLAAWVPWAWLWIAPPAWAELPAETIGRVEVLPQPARAHWVWASDVLLRRSALLDLDSGRMLGQVNGGFGPTVALFSARRGEIYVPETHYSRGSRGERADVLTVYDGASLTPVAEVVLPPRRAINALPTANAALSDDERFAAVFNSVPGTSLSIVDVEQRALTAEVSTPGCSLAYTAGPRRFALLCGDGSLLLLALDEAGRELAKTRSRPFFDPDADPVTEKAVRVGDEWLFVSFEGRVVPVDVSGAEPRFGEPWSLLDAADRADSWRIGGSQHLAVHAASRRLYSLVHQGGADTHKEPGTELWVYDLATRTRVDRVALRHPGLTFLGEPVEPGGGGWLWGWLLDTFLGAAVDFVAVTQDAEPLLVTASGFSGGLGLYDARTGEFLRRVYSGNLSIVALQAPFAP